ncbi:MAG: Sporulation kinase A [bacterium ADurb.Bin429]|nr:MAG: Sporulation kinase A [bacterium ADurb.Bin429]
MFSPVQLILATAVLYNLVLVGLILWKTHANQVGRNFSWYILGNAAWQACIVFMQPAFGEATTLWLVRATFFCAIFFCSSWMLFCAEFPQTSPRFLTAARVMIVLSLPWFFLCWTPWIIPDGITFMDGWVKATSGPLVLPFTAWIQGWTLAGAIHLFYKTKTLRGMDRLQVRYILLGFVGLFIIGSFINLILPAISQSTRYSFYGPLASLFITTTTTYAIVRYRLMDIRIVLRAGIVYSVTIGTLSLLFALLVPVLDTFMQAHFTLPSRTGSFIIAFIIALAFQPLRRYVQQLVDHRFFKSVYDYRHALREAGSALASAHERELLVETLVSALARTLRPRTIAVYLPDNSEELTQISLTGFWPEAPGAIIPTDPVLRYITVTDEVLVADELLRQPAPAHAYGTHLKGWRADVAIPLLAGPQVCGLVLLGEKLSGDVYTADDLGLLRILGKQAAIALINARHFDEMVLLNEYHERLLNTMQDGVLAVDPQGRVLTCNPAAAAITGVPVADALGGPLDALGLGALPTPASGAATLETTLRARAGAVVPVLVTVTPFWRRWETAPCYLLVVRDLSELRALEREKLQAERFSSMGAMAASLAHEIKNPLVPIQTFAHLLPTQYDDAEFREAFSQTVVREVERITRLVGQLLDLVRNPTADRAPVDLDAVVTQLLGLLAPECARVGIRVHRTTAGGLPPLVGDAGQLYQALLNVLTNAVQAMPDGGELWVTLGGDARTVRVRIQDSGPGVAPELVGRIFEPLYTTKTGGHGLGLALTYQFVKAHGGELRAECPPEGGLAMTLLLPASTEAETEAVCT